MTQKLTEEDIKKVSGGLGSDVVNYIMAQLESDPQLAAVIGQLNMSQAFEVMNYVEENYGSKTLEDVQQNYDAYKAEIISHIQATYNIQVQ